MGEVETKPVLVGHVELDEEGELLKMEVEPEEPDEGMDGGGAPKRRVTQSIVSIRDAKRKENIKKQEWQWFALTGNKSTASASLGTPMEAMDMTRNGRSKFSRCRRNGTISGWFDHRRRYCRFGSGDVESRG